MAKREFGETAPDVDQRGKSREILIKVQSVKTIPVTVFDYGTGDTVGKMVDHMIHDMRVDGQYPNKLVIDLNPPREPNPEEI